MNIKERKIEYKPGLPCSAQLLKITADNPHFHSQDLELIYCLKGEVNLVAGHQNVTIRTGEIFSVDYRDIHYLTSDTDNLVLLFHLNMKALDMPWNLLENVFFSCESCHCYPYQKNSMDEVAVIILSVAYALHSGEFDSKSLVKASNRLMDIMIKYFNWFNYNNQDEYMNMETYRRYYSILAYCNENFMNKISISHLAEREHINANYFSQFISKTVFEKFSDMLKYIRCYEAEQLLLKTDLPVAEISFKCGFSDPKYCYSAFKQWWGCTPTEHRNKYNEYLKTVSSSETVEGQIAAGILKEYMASWMLEKTLK